MNSVSGKIGFVGIGAMGTPMATNLLKAGFKLIVYDADSEHAKKLSSIHEVELAPNLDALGRESSAVITMLPDGATVRKVICGKNDGYRDCVATELKAGSVVIDMSSSSPVATRELGHLLRERGIGLIDAPVSGGVKRAVSGELAIMIGGDKELLERYRPLFEKMGTQIFHAGPLGAGHAIKALNNYVSAAGLIAACEAVIIGRRFGLDPGVIVDILNVSSGMNNTTKGKIKQYMLNGAFNAGFTTGLMAKDLRTALEVGEAVDGPTDLTRFTASVWNEAEKNLGASSDHTEIFRFIDQSKKK